MRIRSLAAAIGAAILLAGLTAAPASAGTGSSTVCSDGIGYREVPVLTSPVTVGVEVGYAPGGTQQMLTICYSTSAVGQPAGVTSGAIVVDVEPGTSRAYPGAYLDVGCYPDFTSGVGPICSFGNHAFVGSGDVAVDNFPNGICLVSVGAGCVAYVPGVMVVDRGPRPLLAIQVLGMPVDVDQPDCITVVDTCP